MRIFLKISTRAPSTIFYGRGPARICTAIRARNLFVIGVTGTKGKTTTLELINAILENAGKRTALISSLAHKDRR